jgi:hypothetical protein
MVKINKTNNNIELFKIVSEKNDNICLLDTYTIITYVLIIIFILIILSYLMKRK